MKASTKCLRTPLASTNLQSSASTTISTSYPKDQQTWDNSYPNSSRALGSATALGHQPSIGCSGCGDDSPGKIKQWFAQAQYFFHKDPQGNFLTGQAAAAATRRCRDRSQSSHGNGCHVVAGALFPVDVGDLITTKFYLSTAKLSTGIWHASIGTPTRVSQVQVPHPYMRGNGSWTDYHDVFQGACMESYGFMVNRDFYPASCPPIKVTVMAPEGTPNGWQVPWTVRQNASTVPFGPHTSKVATVNGDLTPISTVQFTWPGRQLKSDDGYSKTGGGDPIDGQTAAARAAAARAPPPRPVASWDFSSSTPFTDTVNSYRLLQHDASHPVVIVPTYGSFKRAAAFNWAPHETWK